MLKTSVPNATARFNQPPNFVANAVPDFDSSSFMKSSPISSFSTCPHCGAALEAGSRFCSACGQSIGDSPSGEPASAGPSGETITWEQDISLLTNPVILRQTLLVCGGAGLLMAFILTFVFATSGEFHSILPMLGISAAAAAGLGVLMVLVMLVVFGNRTRVRFTVDDRGILWETVDPRALGTARLALLAGVLGRSPTTAGAAAVAMARQSEWVAWTDVDAVEMNPGRHLLTLRNSWRTVMMIACLPQNYQQVGVFLKQHISSSGGSATRTLSPKTLAGPLARAFARTVYFTLATTPVFIMLKPLEMDLFLPLLIFCFGLATIWLIPLFGWVVLGGLSLLIWQFAAAGIEEFRYLYRWEQSVFLLALLGFAWIIWDSWGSVRGRRLPPLMSD